MHWVWLIIVGAIVGALGRLFHPGPDPMGWIVTIVLGIVSLLIGGAIHGGFWGFVEARTASSTSSRANPRARSRIS